MLVTVGDLLEEILVRPEGAVVSGGDGRAVTRRVRAGSAANVAALTVELGGRARFVGQVGDDADGHDLVAGLAATGVETVVETLGRTGAVVSLLDDNGRTRLIDRGGSRRLAAIDGSVLSGAIQLYLPAEAFTDDPLATAVDRLLGDERAGRIAVTLGGLTPAELDGFGADAYLALVEALRPDTVIINADEHAALGLAPRTGLPGTRATVVTNADRPAVVIDSEGVANSVEVRPTVVRDLTGVGDGFTAGYLASRRAGADPIAATTAGHRSAAKVLARLGPTTRDR